MSGRYLEFLEEGRWSYFEKHAFFADLAQEGVAFVVDNINISDRSPAYTGTVIRVLTRIDNIGNKSAKAVQEVRLVTDRELADLIVEADVTFCLMDAKTHKAVPITGDLRANLERMIQEAK